MPLIRQFLRSCILVNIHWINNQTLLFLALPHPTVQLSWALYAVFVCQFPLHMVGWPQPCLFICIPLFASLRVTWLSWQATALCIPLSALFFLLLLKCSFLQHCRKYPQITSFFKKNFKSWLLTLRVKMFQESFFSWDWNADLFFFSNFLKLHQN